jgi:hypothetical protein
MFQFNEVRRGRVCSRCRDRLVKCPWVVLMCEGPISSGLQDLSVFPVAVLCQRNLGPSQWMRMSARAII